MVIIWGIPLFKNTTSPDCAFFLYPIDSLTDLKKKESQC